MDSLSAVCNALRNSGVAKAMFRLRIEPAIIEDDRESAKYEFSLLAKDGNEYPMVIKSSYDASAEDPEMKVSVAVISKGIPLDESVYVFSCDDLRKLLKKYESLFAVSLSVENDIFMHLKDYILSKLQFFSGSMEYTVKPVDTTIINSDTVE